MFNNCELQAKCLRDQVFTHSCCHSSCSAVFFWCSAHLRYPTVVKWPEEKTPLLSVLFFLTAQMENNKTKTKQNKTPKRQSLIFLLWSGLFSPRKVVGVCPYSLKPPRPPHCLSGQKLCLGYHQGRPGAPQQTWLPLGFWFAPTRQPQSPRLLLTGHSLWPFLALPLFK